MAAGLTIAEGDYERFAEAFERAVEEASAGRARACAMVETDGALEATHCSLEVARLLEAGSGDRAFRSPSSAIHFAVENQRVVGERHLKLQLVKDGRRIEAMRFGALEPLPAQVRAAYRLERQRVQRPEDRPAQRGALRMIRALALASCWFLRSSKCAKTSSRSRTPARTCLRRRAWSPTCCATPTSTRRTSSSTSARATAASCSPRRRCSARAASASRSRTSW